MEATSIGRFAGRDQAWNICYDDGMALVDSPAGRRRILETSRVVAVLGAHPDEGRPAFYVPDYLCANGYRVLPVNPSFVGTSLWGEPFRATLAEIGEPVDLVDVFRRSSHVEAHVADILVMAPLPRVVWLQSGIRNDRAAQALSAVGIDVVQDSCTLADHRAFLGS